MNYQRMLEQLEPITAFKLDNGVTIFAFDGYALGTDGKTYYHIGREDEDGDLVTLGWSCEVEHSVILSGDNEAYKEQKHEFEMSSF